MYEGEWKEGKYEGKGEMNPVRRAEPSCSARVRKARISTLNSAFHLKEKRATQAYDVTET